MGAVRLCQARDLGKSSENLFSSAERKVGTSTIRGDKILHHGGTFIPRHNGANGTPLGPWWSLFTCDSEILLTLFQSSLSPLPPVRSALS